MTLNHFLIYIIIGIVFPNNYLLCFIISILWEIFEYLITYWNSTYKLLIKYWAIPEKYWNEKHEHKIIDIFVNFFGFYVGSNIKFKNISKN